MKTAGVYSPETETTNFGYRLVLEDEVIAENFLLKRELTKVNNRIMELEKRIPQENIIVLRDISREQAKGEIRQLYKTGRTLYCSDLVRELGVDLGTVAEICDELEANGELVIDQNI